MAKTLAEVPDADLVAVVSPTAGRADAFGDEHDVALRFTHPSDLVGNVDVAYLVGPKQTADIRAGMLTAGIPESSIITTKSFEEARDAVTALGGWDAGSVVLVANDLPDQFDEFLVI